MSSSAGYILHIAFDNTRRLKRNVYYFRYKDQLFKLIQNNPKNHSDVLLTIIGASGGDEEEKAYSFASEFLSALSWEIGSQVSLRHGGGYGARAGMSFRSARCALYDTPKLATHRSPFRGFSIDRIAKITTEEQKTALSLFRDAYASNHLYLSFLLYWQVLETAGGRGSAIADQLYSGIGNAQGLEDAVNQLSLGTQTLGDYLWEDCRNAIAHIRRENNRTFIRLDNAADNKRILISAYIIQELARYFIRSTLGVSEVLHLVRCRGISYPLYADEGFMNSHAYRMAYA